MALVGALKAVASQVIVLHHLATYGPLSYGVFELFPGLIDWLFGYGRIAVQVFLVVGGFLAARALAGDGSAQSLTPLPLLWRRYRRLVLPFMAAMFLAVLSAKIAGLWVDDDMVPGRPGAAQWFAHALMLHGLLGFESLSAGVWYIAIDFQLFAIFVLLLWIGRVYRFAPVILVPGVTAAALFWFNRIPDMDAWGLYFFGSYGMGAIAWWAGGGKRSGLWLVSLIVVVALALVVEFRLRIVVALGVALVLALGRHSDVLERWPMMRMSAFLGEISFSVFLVHFPVYLLVTALFVAWDAVTPVWSSVALLAAWSASIGIGWAFYHWVERPAASQRILNGLARLFQRIVTRGMEAGRRPVLALRRFLSSYA